MDDLEKLAAELNPSAIAGGYRLLLLKIGDQAYSQPVPGEPGAVALDAFAPDFVAHFMKEAGLQDPQQATAWLSTAMQAVKVGIQCREQGALALAYANARMAFVVASHIPDRNGVTIIVRNLWAITEEVHHLLFRAGGPIRQAIKTPEDRQAVQQMEQEARWVHAAIRQDGEWMCARIRDAAAELPDPAMVLRLHHALLRIARASGNRALADSAFAFVVKLAREQSNVDVLLQAAADEVSRIDIEQMVLHLGMVPGQDEHASPAFTVFAEARRHLDDLADLRGFGISCSTALRNLQYLRLMVTSAGGATGHGWSYAISPLLQQAGRTYLDVLLRLERPEDALQVAEGLLARSMGDWMSRTHAAWAVAPQFLATIAPLTGSLNCNPSATLGDVLNASQAAEAPILYYVLGDDCCFAWVMRRDGNVVPTRLPNPRALASELHAEIVLDRTLEPSLTTKLTQLHDLLFPEEIQAALADQGDRLIIIADPLLNDIPYGALLMPDGRHLLEQFEIGLWPSVTAFNVLVSGDRRTPAQRARKSEVPRAVVFGIETFDYEVASADSDDAPWMEFEPLPGARKEAAAIAGLFAVSAAIDKDATVQKVFEASGAGVIHFATHAVVNPESPENSFVALADGVLTAGDLYRHDPGIRTRLVVLSACETALGGEHADSVIGLANAFLIAGASSVVASLWRVSDEATVELMQTFYQHLIEKKPVNAALRAAQLRLIKRGRFAHPYYWAAFRATGLSQHSIQ